MIDCSTKNVHPYWGREHGDKHQNCLWCMIYCHPSSHLQSFHISFLTLQTTAVLQEWCVKGPLQKILIFFFIEFLIMAALGNYCFWLDNFKNKFPSETTLPIFVMMFGRSYLFLISTMQKRSLKPLREQKGTKSKLIFSV